MREFTSKQDEYYDFMILNAYEQSLRPCLGCGVCNQKFGCTYRDFDNIMDLIIRIELLVVASPIYNLSFPAPLKLIFDRMQPFFAAKFVRKEKIEALKPKKGVILLTCGSNRCQESDLALKQLKFIFNLISTKTVKTKILRGTDSAQVLK
jgi:multimeric flavodoxin WrbA